MEFPDSRYSFFQANQMEESSITNFTTTTTSGSTAAGGTTTANSPPATEEGNSTRREHMFDKVVTPSDVGKLNRLVIPKQHAEKYFPLDTSSDEKGLLLNFEDNSGKSWRFRYSYWNSSQSYVMTKGWSRFVKEKKLIAGDIVSFEQTISQSGETKLFIGWKRRANTPVQNRNSPFQFGSNLLWPSISTTGRATVLPSRHAAGYGDYNYGYGLGYVESHTSPLFYLRASTRPPQLGQKPDAGGAVARHAAGCPSNAFQSMPLVHGNASAKRVRLFGVNLDCPASTMEEEDEEEETENSLSDLPNWFSQSSDRLQLRFNHAGANYDQSALPTIPQQELSRKAKPPSFSFDL